MFWIKWQVYKFKLVRLTSSAYKNENVVFERNRKIEIGNTVVCVYIKRTVITLSRLHPPLRPRRSRPPALFVRRMVSRTQFIIVVTIKTYFSHLV